MPSQACQLHVSTCIVSTTCKHWSCLSPSVSKLQSPHQPRNVIFPKLSFCKSRVVLRSFNPSWLRDGCFLFNISAFKQKLTSATAFITKDYQKLERCHYSLCNHESSACHKKAVENIVTIPATHRDVGEHHFSY